jgi:hypothetical protein
VQGGDSSTEYLFSYRYKKKTIYGLKWTNWAILRDWKSTSSFTWNTLDLIGEYQVKLNARNPGDKSGTMVADTLLMTIEQNRPSAVTLTTSKTSPQPQGSSVRLRASATGGTGSYDYKFMYRKITLYTKGKWVVLRDWSGSSAVTWNTTGLKGKYELYVGARNAGSESGATASTKVNFKITN